MSRSLNPAAASLSNPRRGFSCAVCRRNHNEASAQNAGKTSSSQELFYHNESLTWTFPSSSSPSFNCGPTEQCNHVVPALCPAAPSSASASSFPPATEDDDVVPGLLCRWLVDAIRAYSCAPSARSWPWCISLRRLSLSSGRAVRIYGRERDAVVRNTDRQSGRGAGAQRVGVRGSRSP